MSKTDDGGDSTAGGIRIFRAQLTACQYRRACGKDILHRNHDQKQGHGNAYSRQGDIGVQHSDIGGVHQVVNRLGKQC